MTRIIGKTVKTETTKSKKIFDCFYQDGTDIEKTVQAVILGIERKYFKSCGWGLSEVEKTENGYHVMLKSIIAFYKPLEYTLEIRTF